VSNATEFGSSALRLPLSAALGQAAVAAGAGHVGGRISQTVEASMGLGTGGSRSSPAAGSVRAAVAGTAAVFGAAGRGRRNIATAASPSVQRWRRSQRRRGKTMMAVYPDGCHLSPYHPGPIYLPVFSWCCSTKATIQSLCGGWWHCHVDHGLIDLSKERSICCLHLSCAGRISYCLIRVWPFHGSGRVRLPFGDFLVEKPAYMHDQ